MAALNGNNVTVTWRRLAQEPENATYNIYVDGSKINSAPLTNTNYKTTTAQVPVGSKVQVSIIAGGKESEPSAAYKVKSYDCRGIFMDIRFTDSPLTASDFNTSYVWPVDLDGDGEMDYVVNRMNKSNGLDCYVEGYLRTGEHLWTVKMGPNELICSGQDDQIVAYDIDCDGKGEVIMQTSDGTQFWDQDKKDFGLYVNGSSTADTDGDGITDYETQSVRNAPRYMTVVDGMTGREKCSVEQSYTAYYNRTNRASLMGDEYNKHVGHVGVFYHDGLHPAVVMEWHTRDSNGGHHYYNSAWAFDFSGGKAGAWKELFCENVGGAAFHQIRIGDVNGDGRDEMIEGGYTMDHDGKTLFSAGIAHGDRFRTSDIDPERPGLETFAIQQNAGDMLGQILYDAATGEPIKKWYLSAVGDVGRGECMDIDPSHKGWEMWSTMGKVYDAKGSLIPNLTASYPTEGIWWDGELDRELVNTSDSHYNVYIQDYYKGRLIEIAKLSGWRYLTVYAKRAAFWGDIIGDWREELVLRHMEDGVCVGITGFTTDYTTDVDNIYCLMEDPHYRGDCTTKGYYQSPNPGFYLGYDMPRPQLPPCMVTDLVCGPGATAWSVGSAGFSDYERSETKAYTDGASVLFDLTSPSTIDLNGAVAPSCVYAMPVKGQTVTVGGSGSIDGTAELWKSQQGRFVVNSPMNQSGKTFITEGVLEVNATITGSVELRARGTLAGDVTLAGDLVTEGALNYEGCRLMPGKENSIGVMTLKKGLTINGKVYAEMDVNSAAGTADLIHVDGDVKAADGGSLVFTIVPDVNKPAASRYKLLEYTGAMELADNAISVRGLQGLSYQIEDQDKALWLVINAQREASDGVRWIGSVSDKWDYTTENFSLKGEAADFVAGDDVTVGDDAVTTDIKVDELIPAAGVTFESETKDFTLSGDGGFTGSCGLTKNGAGKLTLSAANSDYTGKTVINGGTVVVTELADGGIASSIGAASSDPENLQIGKATLQVNNSNTATNRGVTLTDTATIKIASGVLSLKGLVKGDGTLVKDGGGQLNITYSGNNAWKSTILKNGTLAMGTWNTSFGTATSPIDVAGSATISVFNNNSTSAIPSLRNTITVEEGKVLTIGAGQRCRIQGAWKGLGTVKISFPYVRGDFETNLSAFEGVLNPTSGQFRLSSTIDLSKGTLLLGDGVYMAHVTGQSGTEQNRTSKIGELKSTVTNCTLSTGTWNVGYLGTNSTYSGKFSSAATVNKYGEGVLTLKGASAGALNVQEGAVSLENRESETTTGLVTVYRDAELYGYGKTASVTVNAGGLVGAGKKSLSLVGKFTLTGNLTVKNGGIVRVRSTVSSCDSYTVSGKVSLSSPVFRMERLSGDWDAGMDYEVFKGDGTVQLIGEPTFVPETPMVGYKWDTSALESDGVIRIVKDASGIDGVEAGEEGQEVYDLSGVRRNATAERGIYIVNGKKVLR